MDGTKLKNQLRKYEEYLTVDIGLSRRTVAGYSRALSIALRRMRKFCPDPRDTRKFMLWMHEKNYSYSHIVNTSLAVEHFARFKGMDVMLGRPRSPSGSCRTSSPNPKSPGSFRRPGTPAKRRSSPARLFGHTQQRALRHPAQGCRSRRQPP
jgi:hypothetical protein